jgi:predicted site-specific integrase-resolvase
MPRQIDEALSEVSRELQVRRRCYHRWIQDGKLSTVDARDRIERLEAAEHYLLAHMEHLERIRLINEAGAPARDQREPDLTQHSTVV